MHRFCINLRPSPMKIKPNCKVTLHYTIKDEDGYIVGQTHPQEPMTYTQGQNEIVPGLDDFLKNEDDGFKGKVKLTPEQAYGDIKPEMILIAKSDNFPDDLTLEKGMLLQTEGPEGPFYCRIIQIDETKDEIHLDGNHPLAGKTLTYEVEVIQVEAPTD